MKENNSFETEIKKKKSSNILYYIIFGLLLLTLSFAIFIGTTRGYLDVLINYNSTFTSELTIKDIITFNYPETDNNSGVIYLFLAYWTFQLFGEYFYFVFIVFLFFSAICLMFKKIKLLFKVIFIFLILFFFYAILVQLGLIKDTIGIIPSFFSALLHKTLIKLFGYYFYLFIIVFISLTVIGIVLKKYLLLIKSLFFITSSFFLYQLIIQFRILSKEIGLVPIFFSKKMNSFFGANLTKLTDIVIFLFTLFLLFKLNHILDMFSNFRNSVKSFILWIKRVFSPERNFNKIKKLLFSSKAPKYIQEIDSELEKEESFDFDFEAGKSTKPRESKLRIKKSSTKESVQPSPKNNKNNYKIPSFEKFLISKATLKQKNNVEEKKYINTVSNILQDKLLEFGVEAKVVKVNTGPIITQYELEPSPGIKVSRFANLQDDLALAIKARSIRIIAPIPGKGRIGIELPNKNRETIYLKDVLSRSKGEWKHFTLPIALGKDIVGESVIEDLSLMPHLLIAGATGSGKSVCVNTIINSILFHSAPNDVRLIMIDPKRIELAGYKGIPHLIHDVVTDSEEALKTLNWAVYEMERRYKLLQKYKVRDIQNYNLKISHLKEKEELEDLPLPYIVIIVDEFADLIMTAGRDIETPITRLAQMARAIGLHLILATQRPSTKVITGIIKANFPSRIAFQVSSKIDSRVILDTNGAEKLLGRGDMLLLGTGKSIPIRIHGAYISDNEIEALIEYLKKQPKPEVEIDIFPEESVGVRPYEYDDELFPKAALFVVSAGAASVSMLQRHFKIGYARAGRLIDMLEQARIIGPHLGSKSRDVLATEEDMKLFGYSENEI